MITRETFAYNFYFPFTIASQELTREVNIDTRGAFELFYITASNAAAFTIEIVDTALSQSLMNQKLPSSCIAGVGQRPFILPVSYVFRGNRTIRINAKNGTTAANAGYITLHGATRTGDDTEPLAVLYDGVRADLDSAVYNGQFFAYGLDVTFTGAAGVAGSVLDLSLDIFNNRAFELFYINTSLAQNCTLEIMDTASGRYLAQTATPYQNICGNAQYPHRLQVNRVFPAHGSVSVHAENLHVAAHSGQLVFIGANVGE